MKMCKTCRLLFNISSSDMHHFVCTSTLFVPKIFSYLSTRWTALRMTFTRFLCSSFFVFFVNFSFLVMRGTLRWLPIRFWVHININRLIDWCLYLSSVEIICIYSRDDTERLDVGKHLHTTVNNSRTVSFCN